MAKKAKPSECGDIKSTLAAADGPCSESDAESWYKGSRSRPETCSDLAGRRWLNTVEIAQWVGLTVRAVQRLTSSKQIPHVKLGHRTIVFDRHAVDAWLEAQVAVSAADAISRLASDPRREELILDALAKRKSRSNT